jgi:hypothetical protein
MSYNDSVEPEKTEFARENKMLETAKMLVDIAVKAQMAIYDVDRETARECVIRAADDPDEKAEHPTRSLH